MHRGQGKVYPSLPFSQCTSQKFKCHTVLPLRAPGQGVPQTWLSQGGIPLEHLGRGPEPAERGYGVRPHTFPGLLCLWFLLHRAAGTARAVRGPCRFPLWLSAPQCPHCVTTSAQLPLLLLPFWSLGTNISGLQKTSKGRNSCGNSAHLHQQLRARTPTAAAEAPERCWGHQTLHQQRGESTGCGDVQRIVVTTGVSTGHGNAQGTAGLSAETTGEPTGAVGAPRLWDPTPAHPSGKTGCCYTTETPNQPNQSSSDFSTWSPWRVGVCTA